MRLLNNLEERELIPIMTGVPLGFRLTGTPERVERKRNRRTCTFLGDWTAEVTDAWNRQRREFLAQFEGQPAGA